MGNDLGIETDFRSSYGKWQTDKQRLWLLRCAACLPVSWKYGTVFDVSLVSQRKINIKGSVVSWEICSDVFWISCVSAGDTRLELCLISGPSPKCIRQETAFFSGLSEKDRRLQCIPLHTTFLMMTL